MNIFNLVIKFYKKKFEFRCVLLNFRKLIVVFINFLLLYNVFGGIGGFCVCNFFVRGVVVFFFKVI